MAQLGTGCAGVADEDVAAVEVVVAVSFCAAATEQVTSSRAHSTVARRPMLTAAGVFCKATDAQDTVMDASALTIAVHAMSIARHASRVAVWRRTSDAQVLPPTPADLPTQQISLAPAS